MSFYQHIDILEFENSSICNAACPQCLRETYPNDHTWFTQTYLPVEFFDRIPNIVYNNLQKVFFNGTMGDPCAAPNFIDVIKKVREKNKDVEIVVNTNGGMKDEVFWKNLASALGNNSEVRFAIDGVEQTNHIYRKNVVWKKLMKNSSAFIEAGGNAFWQYIIFKHNENDVQEAETLSELMGFKGFISRYSSRFKTDALLNRVAVGSNDVIIEPPSNVNFVHKVLKNTKVETNINNWLKISEHKLITCKAKQESSVYIDSLGNVFPCCFVGASLYSRHSIKVNDTWDSLYEIEGKKCNLFLNDWNTIMQSEFFNQIEKRMKCNTYEEGRLAICAANCANFEHRVNDIEFNETYTIY